MFGWRLRRQFAFFMISVLPFVVLGFWLVPKLFPEPTCFDNRKNQGESNIDCGGPCIPCALKHPKELSVYWARAVSVRENAYDAVALVKNSNTALSADRIEYEFTLFDEFGPVAVKEGTAFILAQEELHIIEANILTTRDANYTEFRIKRVDWRLSDETRPNIVVERKDYRVSDEGGRRSSFVEVPLTNRSTFDFREVQVNFVILDGSGNLLGANKIIIERLRSDETRIIKSTWPEELQGDVVTIDVEPRVNLFDPGIILRPQ
jgi:hypothetical protein